MKHFSWVQLIAIFIATVVIRFTLSLSSFNSDTYNHFAWIDSISSRGWTNLYQQDVSPWAPINYPPLTIYSFWVGEQIYQYLPVEWHTSNVRAALYKAPSIITDSLTAVLLLSIPMITIRWRVIMAIAYLFNPALIYNSVWWGQVESLATYFSLLSLLILARRRVGLSLVVFTIALLFKQTALPLMPIMLYGIYRNHPRIKELIGAALVIASLVYFAYAPLTPLHTNTFVYAYENYLSSVGGQPHQWEATVNSLNFWYFLGQNHVADSTGIFSSLTIRQIGSLLTALGVGIALWYSSRQSDIYKAIFGSAAIISLWTFMFATRMHERHIYLGIALLTTLLPYLRFRTPYVLLSFIGFYNLYAVWSEYFVDRSQDLSWIYTSQILALITVVCVISYPAWFPVRRVSIKTA